ncbi:MAG: hypothetical protein IT168_20195 [Bryobacterales bacterium]|nr:hypothetical protein [Bryobacterales bacterium]
MERCSGEEPRLSSYNSRIQNTRAASDPSRRFAKRRVFAIASHTLFNPPRIQSSAAFPLRQTTATKHDPYCRTAARKLAVHHQQRDGINERHEFTYSPYGAELSQVAFPLGGTFSWTFRTFTYSGNVSHREVYNRVGPQGTYQLLRDDAGDASRPFVPGYSTYAWGRLAAVRYVLNQAIMKPMIEMFAYTQAGQTTNKRVIAERNDYSGT